MQHNNRISDQLNSMTKPLTFSLLLLVSGLASGEWNAPEDPDIWMIYKSIDNDVKDQRYQRALEKHIWFHDNVLKHDRSFYGVRLSFALVSWVNLASVYPPALEALEKKRMEAERIMRSRDSCCRDTFHDYVSINRELGRTSDSVALFDWLDKYDPAFAEQNYDLARRSLLIHKKIDLLIKYLQPEKEFEELRNEFKRNKESREKYRDNPQFDEYMFNAFTIGVTTIVALLVLAEDLGGANQISERALSLHSTEEFKNKMGLALSGKLPKPWP